MTHRYQITLTFTLAEDNTPQSVDNLAAHLGTIAASYTDDGQVSMDVEEVSPC